ncbi:MAG: hypothetical protein ACI9US_002953 [Gammaproteobacteria bacterium]|jgi:hypothetical protein
MSTQLAHLNNFPTAIVFVFACVSLLSSCSKTPTQVQVSEQPEEISPLQDVKTEPREGRFSLRSRIGYSDIRTLIDNEIPPSHTVVDSRRLCKRIIGIKACGTANWNLNINRQGDVKVSGDQQHIIVQAPIAFDGNVGMEGKVANALGLTKLDVRGIVTANIKLGLQVNENWCPNVSVSITYDWIEKPTVVWRNKLDFSLEKIIHDTLDKQLEQLEPRLNASIDCEQFRDQLEQQWKNYTFAIDLPTIEGADDVDKMHLNFTPTGFAFSGINTEIDRLGLGFALDGTTVLEDDPVSISSQPLPPLKYIEYQQTQTNFDILLRATYTQLEKILQPQLKGKTYTSDSIASKASVTVKSVALSSNSTGVTVSLGFVAKLPGKSGDINGTVFLLADPEIDTEEEQLSLNNTQLSKVIDSAVWDLLSTVFESQIIAVIERSAIINYAPRLREFEQQIIDQLQDTSRTGGVAVTTKQLSISLLDIIPEASSLAALARVSADLDIDIPISLIQKTAR